MQQQTRFSILFEELLANLNRKTLDSYIMMDSNIDLLKLDNNVPANFFNSCLAAGYLQCVKKATRFQNDSRTLIDHILVSSKQNEICTGTIISDVSDHFFTFICMPLKAPKHAEKTKFVRTSTTDNVNRFRALLAASDWSDVTNSQCVDTSYDAFWSTYSNLYEICFPLKKIRFNRNIHKKNQFMTEGLLKSRRTKQHLYEQTLTDASELSLNRYKNFSRIYYKTVRAAKKLHYSRLLASNAKNVKKTWNIFNELLGKSKSNDSVEKINIEGRSITDPAEIASEFNGFFTSIGKKISNSIPPIDKQPEDYINYGREIPLLNLGNTTPEHVKKIIGKLASKNSCDVNGVSTRMIKAVGNEIALPLSHIFNLSLSNGKFPTQLKKCRVIPIFKAGDHAECDNYRPISLLSSISKVLEKIVAEKLIEHLLANDLLYMHQYGFLPNRSSEQNLLQIVNYISSALNDNMYCIGVFLDLKKAFDVCSHEILLKKLKKMGIQGKTFEWFSSYLSDRAQCVDINGTFSPWANTFSLLH